MDIKSLKSLLSDFDPEKLLPDLSTVAGKAETILRIGCLIGPIVMLVLGLMYLFLAPKEANYKFGYRTHRGMASVESWQFTQKLAGIVWSAAGLVLSILMLILCGSFRGLEVTAMVTRGIWYLVAEVIVLILCALGIWITVMVFFDRDGYRRR